MSARWALDMAGDPDDVPLHGALEEIVARFSDGATRPDELPQLARFALDLHEGRDLPAVLRQLQALSHDGYLRGAVA